MSAKTAQFMFWVGVLILIPAALLFGPLITIWSLNAIFSLSIEYSFSNWFATLWLCGIVSAVRYKKEK